MQSVWGMLRSIWKKEGLRGWFAGIVPALILVLNPAIQFFLYDLLKEALTVVKVQVGPEIQTEPLSRSVPRNGPRLENVELCRFLAHTWSVLALLSGRETAKCLPGNSCRHLHHLAFQTSRTDIDGSEQLTTTVGPAVQTKDLTPDQ